MEVTQALSIPMASTMNLEEIVRKEIRNISVLNVKDQCIMVRDGNIIVIIVMTAGLMKGNWMPILRLVYG